MEHHENNGFPRTPKAGHMSNLASLRFRVNVATERRKHTQVDFLWIARRFRTIAVFPINWERLDAGVFAPTYRRQNVGVEHSLLEQLMLFPNASIVLEDVDTHRSNFCRRVNAQTKRRQSHVNAGTVPESENAGTYGRPVAGLISLICKLYGNQ